MNVFACPHCQYSLTGRIKTSMSEGTTEATIGCAHCEAILRVSITTLKEPNKERIEKGGINSLHPATTRCRDCTQEIFIGKEANHVCAVKTEPTVTTKEIGP